ncbi:Wzz/FepE/Etk N-terminal domain-containing protein [Marinobacter mobilis]|uniref:Wzz/FepE/Etk N-terminal domain-containing protein n=1 Tax=Marinobacter mobilis TaxID=488533 RepID=UPI0035C6E300
MNSSLDQRRKFNDEVSLVDLAATFIRRRKVFYAVFVVITLGGLAYAILANETYRYTSLLQVAESGHGEYIEGPGTTIATLENRWLPEQDELFQVEADERRPFNVSFSNPEQTGLIRILSEATTDDKGSVERFHQALINEVLERQKTLVAREERSLKGRLESLDHAIETLQGTEDSGAAIAQAFESKAGIENQLEALKGAQVLSVGRQSHEKTGPKRALIVVLSTLLALGVGVFLVFFAHFAELVRDELKDRAP